MWPDRVPYFNHFRFRHYKLLLIVNERVLDQVHASRVDGKKDIEVNFKPVQLEPPAFKGDVAPTPPEFR